MKNKAAVLMLLLSLLYLSACGGEIVPSPEPTKGNKGMSDLTLKVGEEIALDETGLTLRLNAITDDSRCPANVRCFQAGWVTVDISIRKNGEETDQFFLTLPAEREDQVSEVVLENFTILLLEVRPYPQEPGGIAQSEYRVGLEVVQ